MGAILSRFKKEKSTTEKLEKLEKQIQVLERYKENTQEQRRRIVGNFVAVSIGTYVIALAVTYFYYFPSRWQDCLIYLVPVFLFPLIIFLLRKVFSWYFERILNKNNKKLLDLRAEKKKILEEVMDKEVYKVAVNLLSRFADRPTINRYNAYSTPLATRPSAFNSAQRANNRTPLQRDNSNTFGVAQRLALPSPTPATRINSQTSSANSSIISNAPTVSTNTALTSFTSASSLQFRRPTPFPIVNQQNKSIFERVVDVLVGDGPQDRYAMICKECYAHNGMALKEEFEYTTFRCAFCNALNPSRKERPTAPLLLSQSDNTSTAQITEALSTDDTESSDHSDTESESREMLAAQPAEQFVQFDSEMTESLKNTTAASLAVEEIEDSDGSVAAAENWTQVSKVVGHDEDAESVKSETTKADSVEAEIRQRHSEMLNELKKEM